MKNLSLTLLLFCLATSLVAQDKDKTKGLKKIAGNDDADNTTIVISKLNDLEKMDLAELKSLESLESLRALEELSKLSELSSLQSLSELNKLSELKDLSSIEESSINVFLSEDFINSIIEVSLKATEIGLEAAAEALKEMNKETDPDKK